MAPPPEPLLQTPVDESASGLSRALETTIARFRGYILAIGRRHGLSDGDADDIVQEVRVRLWRNRGDSETLRGVAASYVYRAAASAALDTLRRRRARRTGADVVAAVPETAAATGPGPVETLEERELQDRIFRAVDALLPTRRPVVRMHLAGYEREEIAATLGWTVGRVRNLLSRGLADLREVLAREGIGPEGWS